MSCALFNRTYGSIQGTNRSMGFVTSSVPSHCMYYWLLIVNKTSRSKLLWNLNQYTNCLSTQCKLKYPLRDVGHFNETSMLFNDFTKIVWTPPQSKELTQVAYDLNNRPWKVIQCIPLFHDLNLNNDKWFILPIWWWYDIVMYSNNHYRRNG